MARVTATVEGIARIVTGLRWTRCFRRVPAGPDCTSCSASASGCREATGAMCGAPTCRGTIASPISRGSIPSGSSPASRSGGGSGRRASWQARRISVRMAALGGQARLEFVSPPAHRIAAVLSARGGLVWNLDRQVYRLGAIGIGLGFY